MDAYDILGRYGFPPGTTAATRKAAVRRFQAAWAGGRKNGSNLNVDGILGPHTTAALNQLAATTQGYLSPHFTVAECRSKGNGNCYIRRDILRALEALRAAVGATVEITSGYRDPAYNKRIGGATKSQHLYGLAVDISTRYPITVRQAKAVKRFSGLGSIGSTAAGARMLHFDVRHMAPATNWTDGTVAQPTQWRYQ